MRFSDNIIGSLLLKMKNIVIDIGNFCIVIKNENIV